MVGDVRTAHDSYDYQTEWLPENWDVQMRLTVRVVAQTEDEMGGDVVARWGEDATSPVERPAADGFGAGLMVAVQPFGSLRYESSLSLYPQLAIEIL